MKRRDFLKYGAAGLSALCVGDCVPWIMRDEAEAQVRQPLVLNFRITDAIKEMATHNAINPARCYFWIYREESLEPDCPGPHIFATTGTTIQITITNELDEVHNMVIPGPANPRTGAPARRPVFDSGPIAPGATVSRRFRAPAPGTYLYHDSLNAPVNRVMGLHGAFISMPRPPRAVAANRVVRRVTPYLRPTPSVQRLFNHLGSPPSPNSRVGSVWFPGLSWEQGDTLTNTPPFRQYIWLLHQASPNLFAAVGDFTPGQDFPADQFVNRFLRDEFQAIPTTNAIPQYFTINGQSGHFSHNSPYINPNNRVGEPVLIRVLNAGLWTHSLHMHGNHFYVLATNGLIQNNLLFVDTFNVEPMDIQDYLIPYHRPPDIPNSRGIGMPDPPLVTLTGGTTWPPNQELATFIPDDQTGLNVRLSPLCYPMHDHSEPSQTSQGGNYNMGMIAGFNIIGDRTLPGGVVSFPHQPLVFPPGPENGKFPPAVPPPWMD
ncbi:MAG: multicopper oxidase domain-containing protein [Syntrophobacteraceae bacterium]|nr:multicopper oxidase domain-containing protein [Syntrophobacteraceae bacterium]